MVRRVCFVFNFNINYFLHCDVKQTQYNVRFTTKGKNFYIIKFYKQLVTPLFHNLQLYVFKSFAVYKDNTPIYFYLLCYHRWHLGFHHMLSLQVPSCLQYKHMFDITNTVSTFNSFEVSIKALLTYLLKRVMFSQGRSFPICCFVTVTIGWSI